MYGVAAILCSTWKATSEGDPAALSENIKNLNLGVIPLILDTFTSSRRGTECSQKDSNKFTTNHSA